MARGKKNTISSGTLVPASDQNEAELGNFFKKPHFFTANGGPHEKRHTLVTLSVCVELVIFESSW